MGVKSVVPYSKLTIRKSQVFSTRSYVYLQSYVEIRLNRVNVRIMCMKQTRVELAQRSHSLVHN